MTSYLEGWRRSSGGDWVRIAVVAADAVRFEHTHAPQGILLTYRMRAVGESGPSAWSNEIGWTTPPQR